MSRTAAIHTGINVLLVGGILYAAWLMLLLTMPYTAFRPGIDFLKQKVNVYHIEHWRGSFYVHIFTALLALLAGLTQFSGYLLRHHKKVHRTMGYVYAVNVLFITGPAALIMSYYANGGVPAQVSFVLQSICWIVFTGIAVKKALKKQFIAHGEWMFRSYALTLAAITLRAYNALLWELHVDMRPVDKYILIAWASWTLNLILAELLIKGGVVKRILKR